MTFERVFAILTHTPYNCLKHINHEPC